MNGTPSLKIESSSFLRRHGSLLLFLLAMALLGFLAQFQWIGDILLVVYAVVAIIKRLSARTTFITALLTLGMVPVAIIFANWTIAQNFAAYSFILLVFGVISTTVELRQEPRLGK